SRVSIFEQGGGLTPFAAAREVPMSSLVIGLAHCGPRPRRYHGSVWSGRGGEPTRPRRQCLESNPRALVVADADDQLGSLCEGLDRLGWRTVTARSLDAALLASADLPVDAAIVDLNLVGEEALARLRDSAAPRYLSILGIGTGSQAGAAECDLVVSTFPHPLQTAIRLE